MVPLWFSSELKAYARTGVQTYVQDPLAAKGLVRVTTRLVESCRSEGVLDNHTVICDEPAARGGTGQGPPPLSYFLASLGF